MRNLITCLALAMLVFSCKDKNASLTPPMGWNSYDCYGYGVTEKQVKENADYMSDHLKNFGWQYIVVDFLWSLPDVGPEKQNSQLYQDEQFSPRLSMDKFGRLLPDTGRFPSSVGKNGFLPLATYIHAKGLKFGIHIMRGIPRQASVEKAPIIGTAFLASQVANSLDTCNWMNHMYGLNMSKPGAQEYLNSIFKLYASWGVDLVKIDDLSSPYHKAEIEGYRKAIDLCGRKILLSCSPGETPLNEAAHISANANMWRLLGDLWDDWKSVDHAFDVIAYWNAYRSPGHWPDPDMLPLGKLSKYGPVGPERFCRLSAQEQYSLMTLWCISSSPLMFGGNLPECDSLALKLITNQAAIEVDQHATINKTIIKGINPVWYAENAKLHSKYLALFNRDTALAKISFALDSLQIHECEIYDIWENKSLGMQHNYIKLTLLPHSCAFYKLEKAK